jgi:hypothetical protein
MLEELILPVLGEVALAVNDVLHPPWHGFNHVLNSYKGTKPLMSSLLAFHRVFYRLEIQSVMLIRFQEPRVWN